MVSCLSQRQNAMIYETRANAPRKLNTVSLSASRRWNHLKSLSGIETANRSNYKSNYNCWNHLKSLSGIETGNYSNRELSGLCAEVGLKSSKIPIRDWNHSRGKLTAFLITLKSSKIPIRDWNLVWFPWKITYVRKGWNHLKSLSGIETSDLMG